MVVFYSEYIEGRTCRLGQEESWHCIKVLRHKAGDMINVIDGNGNMFSAEIISDSPKDVSAEIKDMIPGWGGHPYNLRMAVCPTKNPDRFEWFAEKACEIGIDRITPLIGEHSERKVFKKQRIEKILLSATKQSLKAKIPICDDAVTVSDFIRRISDEAGNALKLIAYCFEDEKCPRISITDALDKNKSGEIIIMIGPEGDFSRNEALEALKAGFIPVHLGNSRLRTETAALTATEAVYLKHINL